MITTDNDVKMEDQILMLYNCQAFCVSTVLYLSFHAFTCLYTYNCNYSLAIDIRDSTGTVIYSLTMSDLGARPTLVHGAIRKRHVRAAYI